MDIIGSEPNLSFKCSVTIGTMINFHGDSDGHRHGEGTCKWALTTYTCNLLKQDSIPGAGGYVPPALYHTGGFS